MCVVRAKLSETIRLLLLACAIAALLLCAFGVALALDTTKPLAQYGRQSWQSDSGLPQNTVHSIVQTKDGFLWMATEGGLVRFDGQDFRVFDTTNTPALPSDSINDLAVDSLGSLWISCFGGLARMEGQRFTRIVASGFDLTTVRFVKPRRNGGVLIVTASGAAIDDGSGIHAVSGIASDVKPDLVTEGDDGTLWIGAGQQFFSIAPGSTVIARAFTITDIGDLQTISSGANGDLWAGGRNGLALFRNGVRIALNLSGSNGSMDVAALLPLPNSELLFATGAGLFTYVDGVVKRVGSKTGFDFGRPLKLFQDREGTLWAAFDRGVSRILQGELQQPIAIPGVLSLFEDREGDMWFGTDVGGATVLREQAISTLTTQDGLSDDFVRAVFQDRSGTVWIGTNRGGLNRIVDGKVGQLASSNSRGLSSNVVLALAESGRERGSASDLWIGTPDGLGRLRNGQVKLFTTAEGLPDDFVRSLYTDRDGSLWIGTRNGLSHFAAGKFTSYSRLDGLGSDLIGSILRTRDGTLWVGTLGGLSRFDGTEFRNFTQKDGLTGDAITALAEDTGGNLWIAVHGAGLTRLSAGKFMPIPPASSGLPQEIYSIVGAADSAGKPSLWLGSSKGIFRVSLSGLNTFANGHILKPEVERFGTADGMKIDECSSGGRPAAWKMADGSLWFATLKGIASMRPDASRGLPIVPLTAIEQVLIDDLPVDLSQGSVIVPPGLERITIHYAGLSFAAPQKVRFRYMLEGFDHDWIEAGSRRTAYYTNVPAGKYRFLVGASNRDGMWSEASGDLRITVKPHFYRTIWFYVLVALLVGCLVYAVYWLRLRSVENRYRAVSGERNRIAREIHDTLAQGYVGISVQLELVTRMLRMSGPQGEKGEAAIQQLESTKELVRSSLAEARSSIWNLRAADTSAGTESDTLPARLAAAVQIKQQGGTCIRLEVHGSFRPLERRVEDELLRIAQEAIANAVRHANAGIIDVVLGYDTGWLRLTVSDDGSGFERSAVGPGHYGLQGIEERAAQIRANLVVDTRIGAGTTIQVSLDLAGTRQLENV